MNRPDSTISLARALVALRDDLAGQPPPASVLVAARKAAHRAANEVASDATPGAAHAARPPTIRPGLPHQASAGAAQPAWWRWRPPGWADWGAWTGVATCATVLLLSLLVVLRPPTLAPALHSAARGAAAGVGPGAAPGTASTALMPAMDFVPLVSAERLRELSAAQEAPAWLLTTELAQQRLAAMGLPYDPSRAAEPLRAELLVAGSGEVLAMRLLF